MMTTYTSSEIDPETISADDLFDEVLHHSGEVMHAYRIDVDGHAEAAQALYLPGPGRMGIAGIAWDADATWLDVAGVEQGIDMWLTIGVDPFADAACPICSGSGEVEDEEGFWTDCPCRAGAPSYDALTDAAMDERVALPAWEAQREREREARPVPPDLDGVPY